MIKNDYAMEVLRDELVRTRKSLDEHPMDNWMIQRAKSLEAAIETIHARLFNGRWESDAAFSAACEAATAVPMLSSIAEVNAFQDHLRENGFAIQKLETEQ